MIDRNNPLNIPYFTVLCCLYVTFFYQVLETNRAEQSQSHVHRMYFMGPNTFSEPWHLSHIPAEEIKEIVLVVSYFTSKLIWDCVSLFSL